MREGGFPVGTLAIGAAGAANAGLLAVAMLATTDTVLRERLVAWRANRRDEVLAQVKLAMRLAREHSDCEG